MARSDVTIIQQSEFQKYGPGTILTPSVRVQFRVGIHGPFSVELPLAGFSADKVWAAIDPIADEILAVDAHQA